MGNQTEIKKSYANLSAIKKNCPDSVGTKHVNFLNSEIERLIKIGFTCLEDFKIPESELRPRRISMSPIEDESNYSTEKYIDREFFLIKLDALLSFFEISPPEIEIGFKAK